jgi:hypothetical protein
MTLANKRTYSRPLALDPRLPLLNQALVDLLDPPLLLSLFVDPRKLLQKLLRTLTVLWRDSAIELRAVALVVSWDSVVFLGYMTITEMAVSTFKRQPKVLRS